MQNDKLEILKLKDGECYVIPEGDYGKAEVWFKNNRYFLFEIPFYGGNPHFNDSFTVHNVDNMLKVAYSWT